MDALFGDGAAREVVPYSYRCSRVSVFPCGAEVRDVERSLLANEGQGRGVACEAYCTRMPGRCVGAVCVLVVC